MPANVQISGLECLIDFILFVPTFESILRAVPTPGATQAPQGTQSQFFIDFGWILGVPGERLGHPWVHFSFLGRSRGALGGGKVVNNGGLCGMCGPGVILGA